MNMWLYRVDSRDFKEGDIITPQVRYAEKENEICRKVEGQLNKLKKENCPDRKDCLFLFCNLSSALLFWNKYGGTVYAVSVVKVIYKGDMNMLDNILDVFKVTEDEDIREKIASKYWEDGTHVFQPCYEILTDQATVIKVLADKNERQSFISQMNITANSVERTELYKKLIKEIV